MKDKEELFLGVVKKSVNEREHEVLAVREEQRAIPLVSRGVVQTSAEDRELMLLGAEGGQGWTAKGCSAGVRRSDLALQTSGAPLRQGLHRFGGWET